MSAIALNNRVTSYSDSDAAFASCTVLPIQQTTLNIKDMENMEGGNPFWIAVVEVVVGLAIIANKNPRVAAIGGALVGTGVGQLSDEIDAVIDFVSKELQYTSPSYIPPSSA